MIFGIPVSASGVRLREEGAMEALLSYCDEVGVDHVAIGPPMRDGRPDTSALIELKKQLNSADLKVYGGGILYAQKPDFIEEAVRNEERRQFTELIQCYGEAKVDPITVFCRVKPTQDADEWKARWKLATDFLRVLVNEAEAAKVHLAMHTLTDSVFNRYETIMQMFSDIPSDYLGVCYDVEIHVELGDNIPDNLHSLRNKMPLIHLRTVGDVTPWRDFEVKDGKLQKAATRANQVNFPSVMRALVKMDYKGILGLEHQTGPIAYARAVGYLKGVLEAVS